MSTIQLVTSDEKHFTIPKDFPSQTIQDMMKDIGDSTQPIPIMEISSNVLAIIIDAYKKEAAIQPLSEPEKSKKMEEFQKEFMDQYDGKMLNMVTQALNFLDYRSLFDICCQKIANIIKEKTVEELRAYFDIQNDFTPEEEEQIKKETEWADED